jgi:lycopene cyclase domain-containing protein
MNDLMRVLYLIAIVVSLAGVLTLDRRYLRSITTRRLLRTMAVTVPLFLAFDVLGAARGWFASDPRLNVLIVRPGVPLEEPLLLAFITLVSISFLEAFRKSRP